MQRWVWPMERSICESNRAPRTSQMPSELARVMPRPSRRPKPWWRLALAVLVLACAFSSYGCSEAFIPPPEDPPLGQTGPDAPPPHLDKPGDL